MRRYRVWVGNPKGTPEREDRCIVAVFDGESKILSHQCIRKKVEGSDFCKMHKKMADAGKKLFIPEQETE